LKKIIFFLSIPFILFASSHEISLEQKIVTKMAHAIVKKTTKSLKVWVYGGKLPSGFHEGNNFEVVSSCRDADILLIDKEGFEEESCKKTPLLVLDYELLSKYRSALGAFFWQKGRPNIVFIAPRLQRHGIKTSNKFAQYVESRVW